MRFEMEKYGFSNRTIPDHLQRLFTQLNEDELGVPTKLLTEELDHFCGCGIKIFLKRFELITSAYTVSHGRPSLENVAVIESVLSKRVLVKNCSLLWLHRVFIAETGVGAMFSWLRIVKALVL